MKYVRVALLLGTGAIFVNPPDLNSCGPFIPEAQFAWLHGPVGDKKAFIHGDLGVLRPHFYRRPLVIAYRALAGVPSDETEVTALMQNWSDSAGFDSDSGNTAEATAVGRWIAARNKVPGVKKIESIEVTKEMKSPDSYGSYTNCLDDAFDNATATLRRHLADWKPDGLDLAQWVHAQDQVFENCSAGPSIPSPTPQGAAPALAADRQYQIASAEFYAGQFADAERDFGKVAANTASPWHDVAPYLIVRTLIREGTVGGKDQALRDAQQRLQGMLKQSKSPAADERLLNFLHARLDPKGRMAELGAELLRPRLEAKIGQDLTDYTFLWDKATDQSQKAGDVPRQDELTDWVATFQAADATHAVERWRAKHTTPWLIASLVAVKHDDSAAAELIGEARKIRPGAPAYATAAYYGIKLQMEHGDNDTARSWADEALASKQPVEAHNMFLAERLKLAQDWTEFLRYTPRKPVAESSDGFDQSIDKGEPAVAMDGDASAAFNIEVPLSRYLDASKNELLPASIQADIAQAGWVRAVILDKKDDAAALTHRLIELRSKLAPIFKPYLAESDAAKSKFAAVFLMLSTPGLQPVTRIGFGRMTKEQEKVDEFRDNWWDLASAPPTAPEPDAKVHEPLYDLYPSGGMGPKKFLPAPEIKQGETEWASISKAAVNGPNYLCSQTVAWARAHADDPRVPEALHLCVHATRYGPTDDNTGARSKEAFDLLHAKYPNSKWAKETKYWFK